MFRDHSGSAAPNTCVPSPFRALTRWANPLPHGVTNSSRTGTRRSNEAQLNVWREKLTPAQIDRAVEILTAFGLHELYDDATMPKHAYAAHVREA